MVQRTWRIAASSALALACVMLSLGRPTRGAGADQNAAGKASIRDLAWIAGDWRSEQGDSLLQEHWDEPLGDSMMAMFRWLRGDKLWMSEHITVVDEGDRITYRFRHFSRDLSAWEDKNDPIVFDLLSVRDGHAVFENPNPPPKRPKRFIYTREGDTLTVRIEGEAADKTDVFTFRRHE